MDEEVSLVKHCLTSGCFQWNRTYYEQNDSVVVGSPVSLVIAIIIMKKFEEDKRATARYLLTIDFDMLTTHFCHTGEIQYRDF